MSMEMKRERIIDDSKFLPPEIITEILSRLPADSAEGCRVICKQWRFLIDEYPSFVNTHTSKVISLSFDHKKFGNFLLPTSSSGVFLFAVQGFSSFRLQFIEYNEHSYENRLVPDFKLTNYPIFDHLPLHYANCSSLLISSCNGLVFIGPTRPNDMFICNPFTREYLNLRSPITISETYSIWCRRALGNMTYGFGYSPCTNEYKIVSIYYDYLPKIWQGQVSVYTLGSGKWRNKSKFLPYKLLSIHHQPGLLANGAIHWYTDSDDNDKKIVSFDLADEEFRVIVPLPPATSTSLNYYDELGVLGGCLCLTRSYRCSEMRRDVWILNFNKGEEEMEFSWNRRFGMTKENISQHKIYAVSKSGKILLYDGNKISSYEPKTGNLDEDVCIFPDCKGFCTIIPYTKSFVCLKALGEEDAKC